MQLLIYRRWSNRFACFPSDWPGCAATDCGWPAPASSAASQCPWICAAPSEASGCSRQRPSGWCLCSSASRCQCRNTGKRGKRDSKPWVPECMFTAKKDKTHSFDLRRSINAPWLTDHWTWVLEYPAPLYGHLCWTFAFAQLQTHKRERVNTSWPLPQYIL